MGQQGGGSGSGFKLLQRPAASGGIDGDGGQQVSELIRAGQVEGRKGAAGKPGHLLKGGPDLRLLPFLKHEQRHLQHAQFPGQMAEFIRVLFNRITHEHYGPDLLPSMLGGPMLQHFPDLCVSAQAAHPGHLLQQVSC